VVADNVGQIAEYLDGGRCGILCDPENRREMAGSAVRHLSDPEKRRALGEAGRRHLLENFRWSEFASKLVGFYEVVSRVE
jgi:glycosyltransferase involved in cell wall biosynthesis